MITDNNRVHKVHVKLDNNDGNGARWYAVANVARSEA